MVGLAGVLLFVALAMDTAAITGGEPPSVNSASSMDAQPGAASVSLVSADPDVTFSSDTILVDEGEEKKEEDDDEEEKDYWKDVTFDRENFQEILNFVGTHYIDPEIDRSRAFIEACNYVMFYGMEPGYLVYPEAFYKKRKGHPDEEGALDGPSKKIIKNMKVVAVRVQDKKEEEEPRKRLSDAEIRELRKKDEERTAFLESEWKKIRFERRHFDKCFSRAKEWGKDQSLESDKELWLSAARGYLRSLDPHSSIVSAAWWDESTKRTTDSSFHGIGAILRQQEEHTFVESPIEGQPALKAGIRAGDMIIKVDGKNIVGVPLGKVVERIRGPKGTAVVLTVRREGEPEDLEISIVRAYIQIKNVQGNMIESHRDLGYVKLTGFVPSSANDIRAELKRLEQETSTGRLRGLVLDLRNNSGGLLTQAVEISNMFLRSGEIVTVKNRGIRAGNAPQVYQADPSEVITTPLIVLVNDSAASASEIVAGAIQDNQRGIVLGDRTFGKASVQTLFNPIFGRDYYIKLTVARYYAPSGRTIQVIGIIPDASIVPEIGKEMPLGFREENLGKHLKALSADYVSANAGKMQALEDCVARRGIAEQIHKADPNPQIRFDYQLMKGADYLECVAELEEMKSVEEAAPWFGRPSMDSK